MINKLHSCPPNLPIKLQANHRLGNKHTHMHAHTRAHAHTLHYTHTHTHTMHTHITHTHTLHTHTHYTHTLHTHTHTQHTYTMKDIHSAIKTSRVKCCSFAVGSKGCDILVVTSKHSERLVRVITIKIVDVARQRHRQEVLSLPQTAHLLIIYSVTQLEFPVAYKQPPYLGD